MGSLTFLNDWKKNRRIAFCDMGKCSFSVHHVCWSHAHSHHLCVAHGRFHVAGADADLLRWPGGGLHFCRHWSEILNLVNEGVPYFYLALSSENCAVLATETRWPTKPKRFTAGPFSEKVGWSCCDGQNNSGLWEPVKMSPYLAEGTLQMGLS